jgi:transcriptional regulator with XRE-family HTH domain
MRANDLTTMLTMPFPDRLAELRKAKLLSQQKLADEVGASLSIIRRYEAAQAQPTLDVIRRLAVVLGVSADVLVFDKDERQPAENLRLHFEALSRLDVEDQQTVLNVIDGLMLKHQAQQWGPRRHMQERTAAPVTKQQAAAALVAAKNKKSKEKRPATAGR